MHAKKIIICHIVLHVGVKQEKLLLISLYKQTLKTLDKMSNQYHHCRVLEKYNFLSFDNFRLFWN